MLVFISHNKKDAEIAREIGMFLTAEGVPVWYDEWVISAGDSIVEKLNEGLKDCSHFIIIWSENAAKSEWVRKELHSVIHKAISDNKPRIIPVVLDDTPLPDLIRDFKYIRLKRGNEKERWEIVTAVTGHGATRNYVKAVVKKYRELVYEKNPHHPIGWKACPQCGSTSLELSSAISPNDHIYYYGKCKECGWFEWTE